MDSLHHIGKLLILLGLLAVVAGFLLLLWGKLPWLGRLPGDILVERKSLAFYFPLATCLLLSVIGTLVLWLLLRGR